MKKSDLKQFLKEKHGEKNLFFNLGEIKEKAEPILSQINITFPEYTVHNVKHSEKLIEDFNWIIPDSLKKNLNKYEIFFLLASAYLHDIGMASLGDSLSQEEIRSNHHIRTEEFIVNNFKDFSIRDEHQARIIGRICRGHRRENLSDRELFDP